MKKAFTILILSACAFSAGADAVLLFGFDNSEPADYSNGITYNGTTQSITFSDAISSADETTFTPLNGVSSLVSFNLGNINDVVSFGGTITPVGGDFNIGGNGGGVLGGSSDAYFDSGEAWVFTFSHDVVLTAAHYYAPDAGGQIVLTNGTAVSESPFNNDFSGLRISVRAGDELTFGQTGAGTYALQDFNITVVPEPATIALIGLGGLLALISRRLRSA